MRTEALTPEIMLEAYGLGIFPMAETRDAEDVFWVDPRKRGILPLDGFHISRSLGRRMRRGDYTVSVDRDFAGVVAACADRDETWINDRLFDLYERLHAMGRAHSLEVRIGGALAGGVFGVALGGAFFGESMFSRATDASKIALAYLVDRLRLAGFTLFDTQFITPHLASLGAVEIPRAAYRERLAAALTAPADFTQPSEFPSPEAVLQRNTQTS
jgi:leucyl/phenylalanyl-tRNA--protein transferase